MKNKIVSTGLNTDENLQELYTTYDEKSFPLLFFCDILQAYPQNTISVHWHHMLELTMVLTGKALFYVDGHPYEVNAGECIFLNKRVLHRISSAYNNVETTIFGLWFSPSFLATNMESTIYKKYFRYLHGKELDSLIITPFTDCGNQLIGHMHEAYRLFHAQDSFGYELSCLSLIAQIWKSLLENIQDKHKTIFDAPKESDMTDANNIARKMLSYIHEHYAEKITIDTISKELYASRSKCFNLFKNFTGQTPNDYINAYRIEQAELLLMNSTKSIAEISDLCGFSSMGYLTKLFKKKHHLTPSEYRKKFK